MRQEKSKKNQSETKIGGGGGILIKYRKKVVMYSDQVFIIFFLKYRPLGDRLTFDMCE